MKGFTLVEMLAALFIFGLLSAAGATVMGSTMGNQSAVRERTERLGAFQRTRAILKADLAQAAARRTRGPDGKAAPAPLIGRPPSGETPWLTLTRRGWENPDRRARASLQYVEYRFTEGRLERRTRAALDGAALGEPQILIEGVEALQVAFLYNSKWSPDWAGTPAAPLPQAVRVDLRLRDFGEVSQVFLAPGEMR
ncbi:MAG TPA: type II secretion system minor pseudopilin GspJ [Caulobacteraceae bacterium]|nr:type II secretion system minor pseudopilin GspJ [Caulobacteraceae bacterium]